MATSGAMADFARLPAQKQVMVFAGIGLLLAVFYWKLIYKSLDDDLDAAQNQQQSLVATNRRLADDLPKYEELKAHKAKLDELNKKNQAALPQEADLPRFFETLQQKVAASGGAIRRWSNKPGEQVESFVKIPVEVEMSGTFMQIKRFFVSLIQSDAGLPGAERANQEPERIVSIENLSLTNPTVANREIQLTAKFTAVTFRQADKPVVPGAPPAAGAGAAPATPAPAPPATAPGTPAPAAAPAPPPMPSAATPAGAKARVDRAVESGDARNRGAAGIDDAKPPAAAGSDRLKGGL
ncbi:MAG TPA: type 4a pilus biogenesis protein PilO [Kofleriaceae bacterium]|jgi:Tfp pilus assembly protein PilO|nr:type 4a pilus biogenesis protein PilO [Kofleriaceae bacterium]